MKFRFKGISTFILIGLLTLQYQNCGNQFLIDRKMNSEESLLNVSCESELIDLFKTQYHPFLKNNCADCHSQGRTGSGYFADSNFDLAWTHFASKTAVNITRNATSLHRPPNTGDQHKAFLDPLLIKWNDLLVKKQLCENQDRNPLLRPIRTISKSLTITATNQTLEWNIENELTDPNQKQLVPLEIKIDIKLFEQAGIQGYQFENLQLKANSTKSIQIKNIQIGIGNAIDTNLTSFVNINTLIDPAKGWVNLSSSLAPAFTIRTPQDNEPFFFEIQSVQFVDTQPLPNQIFYADLVSGSGNYNVFRSACISCHNNTLARGGLNLLNETQTVSRSATILSRMKNTTSPMPTSGKLPDDQIKIVELWIQTMANNPAFAAPP